VDDEDNKEGKQAKGKTSHVANFENIKIDDTKSVVVIGSHNTVISGYVEQPANIFISYARSDTATVREIYGALLGKNHYPWMDVFSIKAGEDWFRAINKAIDECEIFLAILSKNSVSRRGVIQKELKKALDKLDEMLPGDIYLIPIRIDDCPIPESLNRIQVLDWDSGNGESKLLEAIKAGLARRAG
jgi:hypothetical protein